MAATIFQYAVGPMANFSYLLGDPVSKTAALIDPGWEGRALCDNATAAGFRITHILLTHTHFDHIGAIGEVHTLTGAPVYVHTAERDIISDITDQITTTSDGDTIMIGNVAVQCWHTPGHSPGGQCFLVDGGCFSGDTLFVQACGRVDLPTSDPRAMFHSLQRLATLPDITMIYPGHDYGPSPTSTITAERAQNPYLQAKTLDDFLGRRL